MYIYTLIFDKQCTLLVYNSCLLLSGFANHRYLCFASLFALLFEAIPLKSMHSHFYPFSHLMTPEIETLRDDDNDVCDMSQLNPLVNPCMMTQGSPSSPAEEIKMTPSPSAHPSSESSSPIESPVDDIPHQNMHVPDCEDSDVSSDASWTTEPGVFGLLGGCGKYMCMYGGDDDSSGIFACTKCEMGTSLCKPCTEEVVTQDKRYLVPEH